MPVSTVAITDSPVKRKRGPVPDEQSDVEGLSAASIVSRQKRARIFAPVDEDDDDDESVYALSTAASLAESDAAIVPFVESHTPLTEASSVRSRSKPRAKKFHCTFPNCHKAFDRPVRLQTHINSHTGDRPHACSQNGCDKSFFKPEHLNRHMKEKHSNQRFVCEYQVRNDDTAEMGPCGKVFASNNKLKRHVAMHEDKEDTTCSWEGCGKVFRKQETLQRHIKKDHLDEDSYLCTRATSDGGACGQAFPTPGQLRGHEARDHEAPKYICKICTNAIVPPLELDLSIGNELDPEFLPTLEDMRSPGDALGSTMFDDLSLEDNNGASLQYSDGVVGFPTYHDLQRHNKLVHPPICQQCGKQCKSSKDLAAHADIAHSSADGAGFSIRPQTEKRFLCPYEGCPRSLPSSGFTKKGNLDVHIKGAHTKEKNFVCGEFDLTRVQRVESWNGQGCGMALGTKQALIGHVRTQHMGVPAALVAKTGLHDKDRKRAAAPEKQESAVKIENAMEIDAAPDQVNLNIALSMLTGVGYDQKRPFACLVSGGANGCQMRFTKEYDLATHLELTHGWNVDDVNEALNVNRQASSEAPLCQAGVENVEMIDPDLVYGMSA